MNTKKVKAKNIRCESCGGQLKFYPPEQSLICERCGGLKYFEKNSEIKTHLLTEKSDDGAYKQWIKENKFIKCDSCGASVILDKYQISQVCSYCGSSFISEIDSLPGLKPDAVIPFEFDEKIANKKFIEGVKKDFWVSSKFKKSIPIDKVHGMYIPAFSFNADSKTEYSGYIDDEDYMGGQTPEFYSSSSRYVKGVVMKNHKNVLVETSSKFSDYDLQQILPYNFNKAKAFNPNFIKGYSVEHYQELLDHCKNIAKNKYDNEIKSELKNLYPGENIGDLSLSTTISNESYSYYLLPVYNLEYTYKGKKKITHINGQTGKVSGDLPKSIFKICLTIGLGIFAFIGIAYLIYCFTKFGWD